MRIRYCREAALGRVNYRMTRRRRARSGDSPELPVRGHVGLRRDPAVDAARELKHAPKLLGHVPRDGIYVGVFYKGGVMVEYIGDTVSGRLNKLAMLHFFFFAPLVDAHAEKVGRGAQRAPRPHFHLRGARAAPASAAVVEVHHRRTA